MNKDLEIIKKKYGEKMMELCAKLFPTLLEKTGVLSELMHICFQPTSFLYDDIMENDLEEDFQDYINVMYYNLIKEKNELDVQKTPGELLSEVGYTMYECRKPEDYLEFSKYYRYDEKLSVIKAAEAKSILGGPTFFLVKNNADKIERNNVNPQKHDEYGTSVICITIDIPRRLHDTTFTIINRYNNTVKNPELFLYNDLDNIVQGLAKSFKKLCYPVKSKENLPYFFKIPGYVKANDGKYYKYNYEINNIYYCPNNIVISDLGIEVIDEKKVVMDRFSGIKKYDKEKYIVLDYFILDLYNKKILLCDDSISDDFVRVVSDIEEINIVNILITKQKDTKYINIITKSQNHIVITLDKNNKIIGYEDLKTQVIKDSFLSYNTSLRSLNIPNLTNVGDGFLSSNTSLNTLNAPNLTQVGNYFLFKNTSLTSLDTPNLKSAKNGFMTYNTSLNTLDAPNLTSVGNGFLSSNANIEVVNLNKLGSVGTDFLYTKNKVKVKDKKQSLGESILKKIRKISKIENIVVEKPKFPYIEIYERNFEEDLGRKK